MQVPLRIILKNVPEPSGAREEVAKAACVLERFYDRITSCRVAVSNPDVRHRKGGLYDVHIRLSVPKQGDIAVTRRAEDQREREHLRVALRKAFAQARRRLQDAARELRGDVKAKAEQGHGKVTRLFGRSGYGFIETSDGREIYFHRNSVVDGKFRELKIGSAVRFSEGEGEKGAQASTVVPSAKVRARRAA
jgi:cold shock CspA family protein